MKNHIPQESKYQVTVDVTDAAPPHTQYAGVLTLKEAWHRFEVPRLLESAGIHYGNTAEAAAEMSFILTTQPWVGATSVRRVAQRFGGESAKDDLEADALLSRVLTGTYSQRTLSRFVNTTRHDWPGFDQERVHELQSQPGFAPHRKGVIILDDFPLPKPYAAEMDYLTPIWDNNLKHQVTGYAVVHLYYYHPHRPGYSLYVEPWLKTSSTGETKPKTGRRAAREGEERSKMDIALDGLKQILPQVKAAEAVIFDSWYSARWFYHELTQLGVAWIGEARAGQEFQIGTHKLTVSEIFHHHRTRQRRVKGFKKGVRAVAITATILPDRYTKQAQTVKLVLVTGLTKKRDRDKGYKLIVTNQITWTARHILRLFSCRPAIEQIHRKGKQEAGWNDFHTRSLAALQCHLSLCLLRSTLLSLLRRWIQPWNDYSLREIISHCIALPALLVLDETHRRIRVLVRPTRPALACCSALAVGNDSSLAC
jgi:hypothetical protein